MRTAPLLLLALALSGCTPNDVTLGGALKHNIAMQTVDPEPHYPGDIAPGASGAHGAKAIERYRKGEVKETVAIKTTSGSSGSGSGSGGQ